MEQKVLSVTQINEYIRSRIDEDSALRNVAVKGEISNYKVYPSGHHYFTLKDGESALKCVMFRGSAMSLRFRPDNGMQVIAMGRISVFLRDGAYQMYCTAMAADGLGDLYAAFEQLKKELQAKGLFDEGHKKPLPAYPGTIGIITSSAGAAVHDILRILRKRYPITNVRLLPVRVQGAEAPGEIAIAIAYANKYHLADLLIVGRGGGSIEDLWAFNDPKVAYAIYQSEIPVISAVGHEPDVTISDYVADKRAATPSNAAELAVPDMDALLQTLDGMQERMLAAIQAKVSSYRRQLNVLQGSAVMQKPEDYILKRRKDLELLKTRLVGDQSRSLAAYRNRYCTMAAKLDAICPLKVLARGYSMAQTVSGTVINSINKAQIGDHIQIQVSDGVLGADITDKR